MQSASIRLMGVLLVGLLLGGGTAQAGLIDWSYNWSIGPAPVVASGTGTVADALYRGASEKGSQTLKAAAVTTSSSATVQHPDDFDKNINLTLHLTDALSHKSGDLTFHGTIDGTLSAHSSHLTESFQSPTQHITLGKHTYTVTLSRSIMLFAPGAGVNNVTAFVNVQNAFDPRFGFQPAIGSIASVQTNAVQPAPEPSTFALAAVGVALLGFMGLQRCRRLSIAVG